MAAMRRLSLLFLLFGAASGLFAPFGPVMLRDRGFGPSEIGLVSALSSVVFVVSASAWGHLADAVLGRARAVGAAILLGAALLGVFILPLPAIATAVLYVAFVASYGAAGPLTDALAVTVLANPARQYGRVRGLQSLGYAVAAIVAGLVYGWLGFAVVWPLFVVLAIGVAVAAGSIPDRGRARLTSGRRGGAIREALHVQPRLPKVLLAIAVTEVGVFAALTFLPLRIVALGGGPLHLALASAVAAGTEAVAMVIASRLVGRIGIRRQFVASAVLMSTAYAAWIVAPTPELIIVSRVLLGLGWSGLLVASVVTIRALLPAELQGSGQSLMGMVTMGGAAFVANVIGGQVYAGFGSGVVFAGAIACAAVGAVMGWFVLPDRVRPSFSGPPLQPGQDAD